MERRMRKFRWFWAWQDDKEEHWLEEMSAQGWHLTEIALPIQYTFTAGEPRRYAYRLDYITVKRAERASYYQLFRDAGWEHLGEMSNWQYWRKEITSEETPEIFTDADSKVQKYRRLLGILIVLFPVYITIFLTQTSDRYGDFGMVIHLLYLAIMVLYAYGILKLIHRISQLRRL